MIEGAGPDDLRGLAGMLRGEPDSFEVSSHHLQVLSDAWEADRQRLSTLERREEAQHILNNPPSADASLSEWQDWRDRANAARRVAVGQEDKPDG